MTVISTNPAQTQGLSNQYPVADDAPQLMKAAEKFAEIGRGAVATDVKLAECAYSSAQPENGTPQEGPTKRVPTGRSIGGSTGFGLRMLTAEEIATLQLGLGTESARRVPFTRFEGQQGPERQPATPFTFSEPRFALPPSATESPLYPQPSQPSQPSERADTKPTGDQSILSFPKVVKLMLPGTGFVEAARILFGKG
jgi:hypothetical protein